MTENMVLSNTAPWPGAVLGGCASKLKHSSLARGRPRGLRSRADAQPGCTAASPLPVGGSGAGVSAFAEKCAFFKEMATHCSTLAREIPRTGEPGELQSMALQKVGHD